MKGLELILYPRCSEFVHKFMFLLVPSNLGYSMKVAKSNPGIFFNFACAVRIRVILEGVDIWEMLICVRVRISLLPWRNLDKWLPQELV